MGENKYRNNKLENSLLQKYKFIAVEKQRKQLDIQPKQKRAGEKD